MANVVIKNGLVLKKGDKILTANGSGPTPTGFTITSCTGGGIPSGSMGIVCLKINSAPTNVDDRDFYQSGDSIYPVTPTMPVANVSKLYIWEPTAEGFAQIYADDQMIYNSGTGTSYVWPNVFEYSLTGDVAELKLHTSYDD